MAVAPVVIVEAVSFTEGKVRYDLATEDGLTLKSVDPLCVYERPEVSSQGEPSPAISIDFDLSQFKQLPLAVYPSTDHTISVLPDAIYGGAHVYAIRNSLGFNATTQQAETGLGTQVLTFVYKPDGDAPMVEGLQSEQLALVLLDRCQKLNARFPSPYNEKQMAGLQMFLDGCRERVESRLTAGTMGQLKK